MVFVSNKQGGELRACMYVHGEGYPDWLGLKIAEFCKDRTVVNGHCGGAGVSNGMDNFAAQLVTHLACKMGEAMHCEPAAHPGWLYLVGDSGKDQRDEWNYWLYEVDGVVHMTICSSSDEVYDGPASELTAETIAEIQE